MLITNLRIVLADRVIERGWLALEGGTIARVAEGAAPATPGRVVDGAGLIAIPGIIDLHGDMLEREVEPRPGAHFPLDVAIYELDKRLAAAGVTTAYAALAFWDHDDQEPVRRQALVCQLINEIHRLRDGLLTDLRVHARFEVSTPEVLPALGELLEAGKIELLSLMDHTPGQGQYRDIEHYIGFISKWRRVGREHVEAELRERLARAGSVAERWALARDVAALAAELGLPIASHDDDTPEKIDLVASLGARVAEFPVTLAAAAEARSRGMHVVMGAPNALRGASHSGNLSAREALDAGLVDCLAADYHPATLLHAAFAWADAGVLSLVAAIRLISAGPAAALGLPRLGSIAPEMQADLCLVEPGARPRVRATLRAGRPIYWDQGMWGRAG
ncbi:MAG: alpha-D-ribose 1-methylphosphonate 5-triphosphate diphosphatase [Chloroflexi bacterium]|nr:alpha-D-ribose 1-methylphosphonate 5-triphosphate diphosphatase [Chloroflexota bacterium]